MKSLTLGLFSAGLLLSAAGLCAGEAPVLDKTGYHLFRPVPREALRDLSTDRPDKTESPYTVDPGHFQVEADLFNYSRDAYNGDAANTRVESWSFANTNLKAGLFHHIDLQIIVPAFNTVRMEDRSAGLTRKTSGFGDLVSRLKINLWGNDGGRTAFAVMPFLKFPTAAKDLGNGAVEGGLIFPFAIELPAGWSLGVMPEFDFNRDEDGRGTHLEWVQTVALGRDLIGNLGGYAEIFSAVSSEKGADWIATFDCGLTYAVTRDFQLDLGVNLGLTRAADDFNPFLGATWRF